MIKLQDISKTFDIASGRVEAVKHVNLQIEKGEIFGIIGFSGAGKSTLVRCINLLETPTQGKVIVDGKELTSLSAKELRKERKKIGMIFQHFNLMPSRNVAQNIAYPLKGSGLSKEQINEKVKKLLTLVGMEEKAKAYPSQLSGGQKQRVGIARALANDPKVLLCDEATSALDPQTTKSILQLLKKLNQELGITIVLITHEMAVVKEICNRVAVMEQGEVVEEGDVFKIFACPKKEITRSFIQTTTNLFRIEELIAEDSPVVQVGKDEAVVRLTYQQKNVSEPLVSTLSREYHIELNIIFSNIEIIQDAPLGGLVAIAKGARKDIEAAFRYLDEKNVGWEVIKNGGIFESDHAQCNG